jgi:DNA polymerase III sliding clamp (beta) subunit (PCNA family)
MSPIALSIPELRTALTGLGKVVTKTATLPVLANIRIDREPSGVALTGTDLDTAVSFRLEQPSEGEPVSFLVPLHELGRLVRTGAPNDHLTLTPVGPAAVSVRYPVGASFVEQTIESHPVDEFPHIPRIDTEPCAIDEGVRTAFHEALQCCSSDETRLILNGVYLDVSRRDGHYLVATDGRHLYASNSFSLTLPESVLIPNQKFIGWKPFAADGEWQLRATNGEGGLIQISSRHWTFVTRQIEGTYPNYRQVIPDESQFKTRLELPAEVLPALGKVIERMPCSERENRIVGMKIHERRLSLLGRSGPTDRFAEVEFEQAAIEGCDVTVFLNRDNLLKALGFGLNKIRCIDPESPVLFNCDGRQMIVMPYRVRDLNSAPSPSEEPSPTPAPRPSSEPEPQDEPETNSTNSPADSPADSTRKERRTMPNNGHTNDNEPKPALTTALERAEALKASLKTTASDLNGLLDSLRQAQREQKVSEKEVQSVRSTLEKLQSVRL